MICGHVYMNIIDQVYGTEKHGIPTYNGICIGEVDVKKEFIDFVVEYNTLDPFYKGNVEYTDSIAGYFSISVNKEKRLRRHLLTFIPPSKQEIKRALNDKDQIIGHGVLEFTKNFNDNPIQIRYEMEYSKTKALVKKIRFKIPVEKMKESHRVIENIEEDRINQLS